jgi:UDP-N-acetylmuramate dehydrogenase
MNNIYTNHSLKKLNTFGIEAKASLFITSESIDDLYEIINNKEYTNLPKIILGGGSNMLFTRNVEGIIIKPLINSIEKVFEDDNSVHIKAGAGVDWDTLVEHTVNNNWGGLENLSLIYGNVGASPIQNIGAYGIEAKETIVLVEGVNIETGTILSINGSDCEFDYRTSIFKTKLKGKIVITHVTYCLSKKPEFKLDYGNVISELKKYNEINLKTIRQAIINIRKQKLPDPEIAGNAGSFFKNPVVSIHFANDIKKSYPEVKIFTVNELESKIPAAFLIENCGWKGYRCGDAGVHTNQPLVLVNYGNAKGSEILQLSDEIIHSVQQKFNVTLEREVNIY